MIVATYSKYITNTYYGVPVDHFTVVVHISPFLSEKEIEIIKSNAREMLNRLPIESFPVAGTYKTLMNEYWERNPEIAAKWK